MKNLCLLILLLTSRLVSGQIISGKVTYDRDNPVRHARVDFICGQDTFYTAHTDEKGYYEYCGEISQKPFTVVPYKKHYAGRPISITPVDGIYIYDIDISLLRMMYDNFCNLVFFEIDETDFDDSYFEIQLFKELMDEHPLMCLKTHCALYPGEDERLVSKRLKNFKKYLISWQIPVERIEFSSEIHLLKIRTNIPEWEITDCPQLPNISFSVTSMEGECLK